MRSVRSEFGLGRDAGVSILSTGLQGRDPPRPRRRYARRAQAGPNSRAALLGSRPAGNFIREVRGRGAALVTLEDGFADGGSSRGGIRFNRPPKVAGRRRPMAVPDKNARRGRLHLRRPRQHKRRTKASAGQVSAKDCGMTDDLSESRACRGGRWGTIHIRQFFPTAGSRYGRPRRGRVTRGAHRAAIYVRAYTGENLGQPDTKTTYRRVIPRHKKRCKYSVRRPEKARPDHCRAAQLVSEGLRGPRKCRRLPPYSTGPASPTSKHPHARASGPRPSPGPSSSRRDEGKDDVAPSGAKGATFNGANRTPYIRAAFYRYRALLSAESEKLRI